MKKIILSALFIITINCAIKAQEWYDCVPMIFFAGNYQILYSNNFDNNFNRVNRSFFSNNTYIDTIYENYLIIPQEEHAYHFSLIDYQLKIVDSFMSVTKGYKYTNTSFVHNGLKFKKVPYARRHKDGKIDSLLRMMIVRPNDTIKRPCVLITNGALDKLYERSYMIYSLISDLALRGYCVLFYETGSYDFRLNKLPTFYMNYPINLMDWGDNPGEKNFYNSFQLGYAAAKYAYTHSNDADIKIDTNNIFTHGISLGGYNALAVAFAKKGRNYTSSVANKFNLFNIFNPNDTIVNNNFLKLVIDNDSLLNVKIKGVVSTDAGLDYNTYGNFIDTNGTQVKIPTTLMFGAKDATVSFDNGKSFLEIGFRRIKSDLNKAAIPNQLIVNCTGNHAFVRTTTDNDNSPVPQPTGNYFFSKDSANTYWSYYPFSVVTNDNTTFINKMIYILAQLTDMNNIVTNFYSKIIQNSPTITYPMANSVKFIKSPTNYTQGFYVPIIPITSCAFSTPHISNSDTCWSFFTNPTNPVLRKSNNISIKDDDKTKLLESFNFYPNPASNYLTVQIPFINTSFTELQIIDLSGKIVKNLKLNNESNNEINIDISDLSNSIYLIKLITVDEVYTKKFVKK